MKNKIIGLGLCIIFYLYARLPIVDKFLSNETIVYYSPIYGDSIVDCKEAIVIPVGGYADVEKGKKYWLNVSISPKEGQKVSLKKMREKPDLKKVDVTYEFSNNKRKKKDVIQSKQISITDLYYPKPIMF